MWGADVERQLGPSGHRSASGSRALSWWGSDDLQWPCREWRQQRVFIDEALGFSLTMAERFSPKSNPFRKKQKCTALGVGGVAAAFPATTVLIALSGQARLWAALCLPHCFPEQDPRAPEAPALGAALHVGSAPSQLS